MFLALFAASHQVFPNRFHLVWRSRPIDKINPLFCIEMLHRHSPSAILFYFRSPADGCAFRHPEEKGKPRRGKYRGLEN
jgi:hypothetical protein